MMTATPTKDQATLTTRRANLKDIPFLAWCNREASSPAPGFCYWDPLLEGMNTETLDFIKVVFSDDALAWGRVEDFFIVEANGNPVAAGSAFTMDEHDYRPLRLSKLSRIAVQLGWDDKSQATFLKRYNEVWSDPKDSSIAPHTSWIIESVAVVPEQRGQGVVGVLLQALFNEGRRLGHMYAGISATEDNESARKAYEKAGFNLYLAYGSDYFGGEFPGSIKYRFKL